MAKLSSLTSSTTPNNADLMLVVDTTDTSMAATGTDKKITWSNVKASLKSYFDTLYATVTSLSSYVPYTGATADLNMGTYEVITSSVHANSSAGIHIHNTSGQDVALFGLGGGVNGIIYGNLSMNTVNKIINMADPSSAQDAATKAYADSLVANLLDYRGAYDASGNVWPSSGGSGTAGTIMKGDMWIVSVAGTLGGSSVQAGDSIIANIDTPGQTTANWNTLNSNISYVPEDQANKSTDGTLAANSTTLYPSQSAVKTYADTKATLAGSVSQAFSVSQLEVGNASDTTLSRAAAGDLAVEGVSVLTTSNTKTVTNKRYQPRVYTATNNASLTPEIDTYDVFHLTAMSAATIINNHSTSTPVDGEIMEIRFLDNGTARALTWGTNYVAKAGTALPTTTTLSKNLTCLFEWNANLSKWNLMFSGLEA